MSKSNGKPLRFAVLIRVSTEKQAKKGESLRTQTAANARDVATLGGKVVETYGGQEHATAGWERRELDRLVEDARRGRFDAVIVAYADRWSRDNVKSEQGLEAFAEHGVRFFIGTTEMNLFDPQHRFFLSINTVVGGFSAALSSKKAIENKIERAKRGWPTCGRMPPGRTFDRDEGVWGIDEKVRADFLDAARRILAGETPQEVADRFGVDRNRRVNRSNMCRTLKERSGTVWNQEFRSKKLNIREVVPTTVPRLLPEKVVRDVRKRLKARRTYLHGCPKYDYLLNGRVFCAACGGPMIGQPDRGGGHKLFYRHTHNKTSTAAGCPWKKPRPWVPARVLEDAVVDKLGTMFGNPAALARACKDATPDADKARKRQNRIMTELSKATAGHDRVLELVAAGATTTARAAKQLAELKARENELRDELNQIEAALAEVPEDDDIDAIVTRAERDYYESMGWEWPPRCESYLELFGSESMSGHTINQHAGQDRRHLVGLVFDTDEMPDGSAPGVYLTPVGPRKFTYELRGRLTTGVRPGVLSWLSTSRFRASVPS